MIFFELLKFFRNQQKHHLLTSLLTELWKQWSAQFVSSSSIRSDWLLHSVGYARFSPAALTIDPKLAYNITNYDDDDSVGGIEQWVTAF